MELDSPDVTGDVRDSFGKGGFLLTSITGLLFLTGCKVKLLFSDPVAFGRSAAKEFIISKDAIKSACVEAFIKLALPIGKLEGSEDCLETD